MIQQTLPFVTRSLIIQKRPEQYYWVYKKGITMRG